VSHPCRIKKTQGGYRFSRNRPFLAQGCTLEASWSETLPKNYLWGVRLVQKISSRSFHSIKSYSFFSEGHTHTNTRTDTCPPIHIGTSLCLFNSFHFTTFALLTPFVKDKMISKSFLCSNHRDKTRAHTHLNVLVSFFPHLNKQVLADYGPQQHILLGKKYFCG